MSNRTTPLDNFVEVNPESITKTYPHDEILYIDISSVGSGHFIETPKLLSISDAPSRAKRIVRDGDTILATVRPNLRSFLFIRKPENNTIASTGFAVLRAKDNADPRFVYYAITDRRFTGYLTNNTKGTSYPAVDTDIVLRGEIPDFDLLRQQSIASILSAYDDLIENNRRRIQLLEQAARLLYKEWFIRLRFPGHEHVKIKDGVPEGWEKRMLGEAVENFDRFRVPLSVLERENRLGPYPYHGAAGIIDYIDNFLFDGRYLLIGEDGTVVAKSGSAMLQFVEGRFWVSNHAHVVQGSLVTTEFLYCFMSHYSIQPHITGVAQPKLSQQNLNRIEMLVPSAQLRSLFQGMVNPLIQQAFTLKSQIAALIQTRDLLLPRLMSGEVAI